MPEKHLTWDNLADFYHRKTGGSIVEAHDQQVRKAVIEECIKTLPLILGQNKTQSLYYGRQYNKVIAHLRAMAGGEQ